MQFWLVGPFKETNAGVHFVTNQGLECVMSIFPLKNLTTRVFGAILPIKTNPIIEIVAGFHASFALEVDYVGKFERFDQAGGYLDNLDNIKNVQNLIQYLRNEK